MHNLLLQSSFEHFFIVFELHDLHETKDAFGGH
jgi:hypothetical protein